MFNRLRKDDGFALVTVLGFGFIITLTVTTLFAVTLNEVRSSSAHVKYQQTIDLAESGIDRSLATLLANSSWSCGPDAPADVLSGDRAAQRAWATAQITAIATSPAPACPVYDAPPDPALANVPRHYVAIRPSNLRTVFSLAWTGDNPASSTRVRLVKAEYLFGSYRITTALLTNGSITSCASYDAGLAAGVAGPVRIHTNSGDACTPGSAGGASIVLTKGPTQKAVPAVNPRDIYRSQAPLYATSWYDLCPDGSVRRPDTTATGQPCTGAVLAASGGYNGWTKSGSTWTFKGGSAPGVYYGYHSDIVIDGNDVPAATTLMTEATADRACPKTDGDIKLKKTSWNAPFIPGLMAVAGGSFYQNTQAVAGSGAFLTQGSFNQHTSAHDKITGSVIAESYCGESNDLQGSTLSWDGGEQLPINSSIHPTLQTELN